tara:strand:- start:296 stop:763 length:468 start_codon:yes stop_codon:yes gene_type:complete
MNSQNVTTLDKKELDVILLNRYHFKGKEKDIENHILENINDISNQCGWGVIQRVKSQYVVPFGNGRLIADIMVWHKDGTGTCIEVKSGKHNRNDLLNAISQSLSYGYKLKSMLGNYPRLVIAAPKIEEEIYNVVAEYKLPINMLMVDGDRCVYLQ